MKQSKGEYDYFNLFQTKSQDIQEYFGPVEVGLSEFGNGMFATRDIKKGELLICEKAFLLDSKLKKSTMQEVIGNKIMFGDPPENTMLLSEKVLKKMRENRKHSIQGLSLFHGYQ